MQKGISIIHMAKSIPAKCSNTKCQKKRVQEYPRFSSWFMCPIHAPQVEILAIHNHLSIGAWISKYLSAQLSHQGRGFNYIKKHNANT